MNVETINTGSEVTDLVKKLKLLGFIFDCQLSMDHQTSKILYFELRGISQLSHFLSKESIQIFVSAFIFFTIKLLQLGTG